MNGQRNLFGSFNHGSMANAMAQEAFPGHTVGLFHGAMNREERSRVYEDFLHRKIDVLISTTAID